VKEESTKDKERKEERKKERKNGNWKYMYIFHSNSLVYIRWCIQKLSNWPPGTGTANCTALCHQVQLYCYFVSKSNEFCLYNLLCCFSTSVYFCCCCCCLFRYGLSQETFG